MTGKHRLDLPLACLRQIDVDHPAVFLVALTSHKAITLKIVDHCGHVAATFQNFGTDLALRHMTQVIKRLQYSKLGICKVTDSFTFCQPCQERIGTAAQFDKSI